MYPNNMTRHYSSIISSPLGNVGIAFHQGKLSALKILPDSAALHMARDTTSRRVVDELKQYFNQAQHKFNLEIYIEGTAFQLRVWKALQTIPCGETMTYGELAKQLRTSPRAIGQACRTCPIPIVIPCHRVVGANHLGGYGGMREGEWLEIKIWLLRHEGVIGLKE